MSIEQYLSEVTREELSKKTVKQLRALYVELAGGDYLRKSMKKDEIIGAIKQNVRASNRGRAFSRLGS